MKKLVGATVVPARKWLYFTPVMRIALVVSFPLILFACNLDSSLQTGADADIDGPAADAPAADAPAADGPAADARLRCSPSAPFGTPTLVPGEVNSAAQEFNGHLTIDELVIYFVRSPGPVGVADIFVATRTSSTGDFATPTVVGGINAAGQDVSPSLTTDNLTIYFGSDRAGAENSQSEIFTSTRSGSTGDFPTPTGVSAVNTASVERAPYVLGDGSALYFSRFGAVGENVFRSKKGLAGFEAPVLVTGLPTNAASHPVISPDERTIYFASQGDIFTASRAAASDPFGNVAPLASLNNAGANDEPAWISPDGCALYFNNSRTEGSHHVAVRGM